MARVLIVEDKDSLRAVMLDALRAAGHDAVGARNAEAGLAILRGGEPVDLLLSDLRLPGMNGLELLETARGEKPELPVILMTAFGTVPDAVRALKAGARDFLEKPVDLDELDRKVADALRETPAAAPRPVADPAPAPSRGLAPPVIVGRSAALEKARAAVLAAAPGLSPILLLGESGTGKELFARLAHHASERRAGPFVAVNCAAIPEPLLENELFGHEKGAFTGAAGVQPGRFERAHGGTLFLDEIGDMSPALQSKLLRAIQEKTYERLGGTTRSADVRIVAATNADLDAAMKDGRFRPDLYYRLAAFPIRLPPLRERVEDLFDLARHFLPILARQHRKTAPDLSPAALVRLRAHPWPGNVREFMHALERALVVSRALVLQPEDFAFLEGKGG